jgi:hypothetical protein
LVRAYEQCDMVATPAGRAPGGIPPCHSPQLPSPMAVPPQATAGASTAKLTINVKRLTPAEIVQHRKDDQCFHCDEFFTSWRKQVCK